jgi:hypothetical protein
MEQNEQKKWEIWGFQGGDYEDYCHLGYDTVSSRQVPMFFQNAGTYQSNYKADTSQKTVIITEGSFFKYKPSWKGLTHSLPVLQADLLT